MVWKIEVDPAAERDLRKLDPQIAKRLLQFLHKRLAPLNDPRSLGEALHDSKLGDLWKYRVGNYRIITDIQEGRLRILVVRVGHRREVYR